MTGRERNRGQITLTSRGSPLTFDSRRAVRRLGMMTALTSRLESDPARLLGDAMLVLMLDQVPDDDDAAAHWAAHADEWIRWARRPGHDAYWFYRETFREFVPMPGKSTLEIGCGEGRISRDLTMLGHRVTATDVVPGLVAAAERARSADRFCVADAAKLPFATGAFDRVVAYNVFMDVPDMPAAVAEAARVLAPRGILTVSIVHPFIDRGTFAGDDEDATFEVRGSYFARKRFAGVEERDGQVMHFAGWSHSLQEYATALTSAGLAITAISEPRPQIVPGSDSDVARWQRLPLFLWMNCTHRLAG